MRLHEILDRKGREVVTISPEAPIARAVRLLVRHGIGSLVVLREGEVVGILTERDILQLADRDPFGLPETLVGEVMTRELIVGLPDDELSHAMELMTTHRVRHLPILEGSAIQGLISIGDVVNALRRDAESENHYLREYVQGMVR
jgi:CBS domain-containing protein